MWALSAPGRGNSRSSGADIGELPFQVCKMSVNRMPRCSARLWVARTLLQLLQALERDLKFVLVDELGGVVHHLNPE